MEFGLFSESGNRRDPTAGQTFQKDLDEIVLAEQLGFTEAWVAEPNSVRPNTVTHAHLLICKAAALTKNIRFGTGIRQLPLHHPVDIVQEANMCDQVTQGRYMFGYGGTHLVNQEQLRIRGIEASYDEQRAMVYESIELILKCWTSEEPFDFEGRFWRGKNIRVLPKPFQQPHPPIATACTGSPETLELAGRQGFIPLLGRGNDTPEEIRGWTEIYLQAAAAAGRAPSRQSFRVSRVIYVAETDAEARADVREGLTAKLQSIDPEHLQRRIPPGGSVADLTFDYMTDTGFYWIGSPDTVYRQVRECYEGSGGFGVLLLFAAQPMAATAQIARSMRLFMEEVAPRLAGLDPDQAGAEAAVA
ncbi:MAG TPA: LLM class flavin-dependent oxidoreductase [Chloroflexota bacterium]|nr:LLM class flavin-dependent oxidoreductase [Chloroflexota bacterium]